MLLLVTSDDQPSTTTVDGWSITVDRLMVGIGEAALLHPCDEYSEAHYLRVLDGRLIRDQKLNIMYGLGQCNFGFQIISPLRDAVLGEGVTEADLERMASSASRQPGSVREDGIAVDFAATATRGGETMRVHWPFKQPTTYLPCARGTMKSPQTIALRSGEDLSFHIGLRGVALFSDNDLFLDDAGTPAPATPALRFDPIAAADTTFGNADGEVTLDELDDVPIKFAQQFGPYLALPGLGGSFAIKLGDYVHVVLSHRLVSFREDVTCATNIGSGRPPL